MRLKLFSGALMALALASSAADAASLSLDTLKAMLTDLGYEPTVSADVVTIEGQGASKSDLKFQLRQDNSLLNIYTSWAVPDDKREAMPAAEMLKANSAAPFVFATYANEEKAEFLDLEATIDVSVVNKKMLRKSIDAMIEQIEADKALWDSNEWKAPAADGAAPATIAQARADLETLWTKAPMQAEHAMFVTDNVANYGAFTAHEGAFRPSDKFHLYMEPKNYIWKDLGNGLYNIGLVVGLKIKDDKDGSIDEIAKDKEALAIDSHSKINDTMINFSVTLGKIPPGSYSFLFTVADKNSDKKVEVTLPFKVVAQ